MVLVVAPIDLVQGFYDVLARLFLFVWGDRVLEIQKDHIDVRLCSLFKHLRLASRHGQFTAIQSGRGLFDGEKTHGTTLL